MLAFTDALLDAFVTKAVIVIWVYIRIVTTIKENWTLEFILHEVMEQLKRVSTSTCTSSTCIGCHNYFVNINESKHRDTTVLLLTSSSSAISSRSPPAVLYARSVAASACFCPRLKEDISSSKPISLGLLLSLPAKEQIIGLLNPLVKWIGNSKPTTSCCSLWRIISLILLTLPWPCWTSTKEMKTAINSSVFFNHVMVLISIKNGHLRCNSWAQHASKNREEDPCILWRRLHETCFSRTSTSWSWKPILTLSSFGPFR